MKKEEFESMPFDEAMESAYENCDCVTTEETLKAYAIELLENDKFHLALHIINAIYENPYYTEWYRYDFSMGTLETPTPITCYEDIEDLNL